MTGSEEAVGMPCFPNLREQSSTGRTGHLAPNGLVRHAGRLLRSDQHATSRRGRDPESDFVSSRVRHADAPGSATWQHDEDSRDPRRAGLLLRQGIPRQPVSGSWIEVRHGNFEPTESSSICLARPRKSLASSSWVAHAFDWKCWPGTAGRLEPSPHHAS